MPTLIHSTDFTVAPDTAAVAAGQVLYDGWIDLNGSAWSISSGKLVGASTSVVNYLYRPSSENVNDERIEGDFVYASVGVILGARWSGNTGEQYGLAWNNANIYIFKIGFGTVVANAALTTALTVGTKYTVRLDCSGFFPTTIVASILRTSDSFVMGTVTGSDTIATSNVAGRMGVLNGYGAQYTALRTYNLSGAPPTTTFTVDNAAFYFSPSNWRISGSTYAETNNLGAYFKINFTGTSASVGVDVSNQAGLADYPWVFCSIDSSPFVETHLTVGMTTIAAASALAAGTHTLLFFYRTNLFAGESWTTSANAIRVTGVSVDSGSTVAAPSLRSKRLLAFGDSITAAGRARDGSDTAASGDAWACYAQDVAFGLDAEVGVIAFGGQSWTLAGTGGVPGFTTSWNLYSLAHSRLTAGLLTPVPDYALVNQGTNGAPLASDVSTWLTAFRAAAPTSAVFVMVPFNGANRAVITTGVANYKTSSGDLNVYLIDGGTRAGEGVGGQPANLYSVDGLHPNQVGHARRGGTVANLIRAALGGTSAATRSKPRLSRGR